MCMYATCLYLGTKADNLRERLADCFVVHSVSFVSILKCGEE